MSFEIGGGGRDASGVASNAQSGSWTPTISNVRPNGLNVDSGVITILSATWKRIGNLAEFYIVWKYTPAPSVIPTVINFNFTFPTEFSVQDFYGEAYLFFTENGPVVGSGGGGIVIALTGETRAPYTGATANTGVGPYPTQMRSNSSILGSVKGILNL